jgi:hypothetical protein
MFNPARGIAAAAALLVALAGCSVSAAEPAAAPAPSPTPTPTTQTPTPTPTLSPEDEFWSYVIDHTSYDTSARTEGVSAGHAVCDVLDEAAKLDEDSAYAYALTQVDDGTDPDVEWITRGSAAFLCPEHGAEVDAWYDGGSKPEPEPASYKPRKSDWKVSVKVRDKQCFGSAGCNVTVKTTPKYVGDQELPESGTIEVTYKLTGDEAGRITKSFTVEDGQAARRSLRR